MTEYAYQIKPATGEPESEYLNKYRATGVTIPSPDVSAIGVEVKVFEGFDELDVASTFRHEVGHSQQLSNKAIDSDPANYSATDRFWLEVDAWDRTREGKLNTRDIEHVIDALETYRHHLKVPDKEWLKARKTILDWALDREHARDYEPLEAKDDEGQGCWVSIPLPEGFDPEMFESPEAEPQPGEGEGENEKQDDDEGDKKPPKEDTQFETDNRERDEWLMTPDGVAAAKAGDAAVSLALTNRGWSLSNLPPLTQALMRSTN